MNDSNRDAIYLGIFSLIVFGLFFGVILVSKLNIFSSSQSDDLSTQGVQNELTAGETNQNIEQDLDMIARRLSEKQSDLDFLRREIDKL